MLRRVNPHREHLEKQLEGSRAMVAQSHRRWEVYVRETKIGDVYGATERAACVRAVLRFKISREDQAQMEVRRLRERFRSEAQS
jgi:hypothetical protein